MAKGIYEIVNLENNKRYVGSTTNFAARKRKHFRTLRDGSHSNAHLQNAFDLYGENSFEFRIVLECDSDELIEKEQERIDGYSFDDLYNLRIIARSNLGMKIEHSEEEKIRRSERSKGNKYMLGYKHTDEAKERIGIASRNMSPETRHKLSVASMGNQHAKGAVRGSEENAARSRALKGREKSVETRARLSEALRGRVHSEETLQRMSIGTKKKLEKDKENGCGVYSQEYKEELSERMKGNQYAKGRTKSPEVRAQTSASLKEYWRKKREAKLINTQQGETSNECLQ
jgi:group I intron endonuclease